jgi:hypothetical protein
MRKALMSTETKPTNPKDAIGSKKLPLDLVPDTAIAEMATAFLEGALKYGKYNWRVEGVRASIYIAAMRRHIAKYTNGEDEDETTRVKHLASAMACCAIIIDADIRGKLVDDRPPSSPVSEHLNDLSEKVVFLQELFKDHNPHQHVITDEVDVVFGSTLDPKNCCECGKFLDETTRSSFRHRLCRDCCLREYKAEKSMRAGETS